MAKEYCADNKTPYPFAIIIKLIHVYLLRIKIPLCIIHYPTNLFTNSLPHFCVSFKMLDCLSSICTRNFIDLCIIKLS